MTSASRSTDNQELRNLLEDFLSGIRYRGIVDLELRKDRRDGRYKLLDFNPRVGAQFRLYRNASGIDVVQAMHLDLTGRKVPQSPGFRRRSFIVENYDLAVIWSYRRMHRLSLREWFRSLPGERELAWFSREDALPFLMMGIRTVYGVLRNRIWPAKSRPRRGEPKYRIGRKAALLQERSYADRL
jgi:D-aspartate ligase